MLIANRYEIASDNWTSRAGTPGTIEDGGSLAYADGYIYTFRSQDTTAFYRYDVNTNSWSTEENTPAIVDDGGALTAVNGHIYGFRGNSTNNFWRFVP